MRRAWWRLWFLGLSTSLALSAAAPVAFAQPAEIGGVARVYLRAGPGPDQRVLSTLNSGDRVKVLANDGFWAKVETQSGKVGYVFNRYLTTGHSAGAPAIAASTPLAEAAAGAPTPVAPTPAAEPATPKTDLAAEIAALRSEISDLKQKVQERSADNPETPGADAAAPVATPTAADGAAPRSPHEQNTEVLAVGLLALVFGLVLGASFARRRSRSQRPRLRF